MAAPLVCLSLTCEVSPETTIFLSSEQFLIKEGFESSLSDPERDAEGFLQFMRGKAPPRSI